MHADEAGRQSRLPLPVTSVRPIASPPPLHAACLLKASWIECIGMGPTRFRPSAFAAGVASSRPIVSRSALTVSPGERVLWRPKKFILALGIGGLVAPSLEPRAELSAELGKRACKDGYAVRMWLLTGDEDCRRRQWLARARLERRGVSLGRKVQHKEVCAAERSKAGRSAPSGRG